MCIIECQAESIVCWAYSGTLQQVAISSRHFFHFREFSTILTKAGQLALSKSELAGNGME